jgi:H+-translocating NAD(P) transhydrogenase subunit alpha
MKMMNKAGLVVLLLAATSNVWAAQAMEGFSVIDGFAALFIFMLAAFTGHEIIGKVPVILHTPLMSGSNFVHGIVLVGAMIALGHADSDFGRIVGFIGVLLGAGNAAGGYVVTERMLEMFKPSGKKGS